ncbi:MAG: DUF1122 domain-containing protein [Methanophagales archaeon ANME-1-THS]|nr:MAG: DUF1122 domain-containing protein [Methanophagales archaeon ANME-1-THS]
MTAQEREPENPLYSLDGRRLGSYTLRLGEVKKGAFAGVVSFSLRINEHSIVSGLYYTGSTWIRPWMEIDYSPVTGAEVDEAGEKLFQLLSELIPPGGHLSVSYIDHRMTARALLAGVPPAATPLGFLLWRSGCRWFKDWYFAEGWKEGGIKLQGGKPLDEARKQLNTQKIVAELTEFLGTRGYLEPEIEKVCKELAARILEEVEKEKSWRTKA